MPGWTPASLCLSSPPRDSVGGMCAQPPSDPAAGIGPAARRRGTWHFDFKAPLPSLNPKLIKGVRASLSDPIPKTPDGVKACHYRSDSPLKPIEHTPGFTKQINCSPDIPSINEFLVLQKKALLQAFLELTRAWHRVEAQLNS